MTKYPATRRTQTIDAPRWRVLVITGREDPMWPFLLAACSPEERASIHIFATDDPRACRCTYSPREGDVALSLDGVEILGKSVRAVWFRRVPSPDVDDFDEELARYCRTEHLSFIEGLAEALPGVLWVSHPQATQRARSKALQLRVAHSLGFRVPKTWFTNDPATMVQLLDTQPTVYKSIISPRVPVDPTVHATVFTTLLTEAHLTNVDGLLSCPAILQHFHEKTADVRATVFGKQVFAVRIQSQLGLHSRVDFRAGARDLPHEPYELPNAVASQCVDLVAKLGLQYGAIDLGEMRDGSFVFFEVNASGQWGWLEEKTGLPMRRALLDLLFGGVQGALAAPASGDDSD